MKKLLLIGLLFSVFKGNAQTLTALKKQIEVLEQKYKLLQDKIHFCEMYNDLSKEVKSFNANFEFKVIECKGNSLDQTVEITITIKHGLPHQQLELYTGAMKPIAYGELGNNYEFKGAKFPNVIHTYGLATFFVPTNLLIQGILVFRNVLPQTEKFSLVNGTFTFKNKDGGGNFSKGEFEIRNLKIDWE